MPHPPNPEGGRGMGLPLYPLRVPTMRMEEDDLKQTLRNTFIRGPPYNTYKNPKPKKQRKPKPTKKQTAKQTLRNTFIRCPPYKAYKNQKTKKGKKRQNRPSEIRLSGVPPIMAIKTQNQKKPKGKIDPQKYAYQGSPHIMPIKTNKKNTGQNRPSEIRLSGKKKEENSHSEIRLSEVPPIMPIKTKK